MKTYEVRVYRDGKFWAIEIPAIDAHTQARHPGEIEFMARDCIALMEEVAEDSFDLAITTMAGEQDDPTPA